MDDFFDGDLHVGIAGLPMNVAAYDLGEGITISQTYAHLMAHFMMAFEPPPTPNATHPAPWKPTTNNASYMADISADLLIPGRLSNRIETAKTILFLIRLRVNPAAIIAVLANNSFSELRTLPDHFCTIIPFEVIPRYFPLESEENIASPFKLLWVRNNWQHTHKMITDSPEFSLAVAALTAGQFVFNHSLILLSLWGALEALFSPSTTELKFRVSSLIAAYLEEPGEQRLALQKQVSKLYDRRSSAAHGKPDHHADDVLETFNLLRRVLAAIVDLKHVPTKDELEKRLFGC